MEKIRRILKTSQKFLDENKDHELWLLEVIENLSQLRDDKESCYRVARLIALGSHEDYTNV